MKRKRCMLLLSVLVLSCALCLCACSPSAPETSGGVSALSGSGSFRVAAEELETSADGAILVYEKERDVLGIRIVSSVSVGPSDWGGVAFYLPLGCSLDNVLCTYPGNGEADAGDQPVELWTTAGENVRYATAIEIGRSHSQVSRGGGSGTVVIEASYPCAPAERTELSALRFGIECGAEIRNGNVIWGVEHDEIPVSLE